MGFINQLSYLGGPHIVWMVDFELLGGLEVFGTMEFYIFYGIPFSWEEGEQLTNSYFSEG